MLVTAGAFCQAFFEDAKFMGPKFGLKVRDLATESEPEKIFSCGIPKARLEHWLERLGRAGLEVHIADTYACRSRRGPEGIYREAAAPLDGALSARHRGAAPRGPAGCRAAFQSR
ncbi:MAG: hypothetical protein ACRELD_15935 [Longimicrobiales bacterium]